MISRRAPLCPVCPGGGHGLPGDRFFRCLFADGRKTGLRNEAAPGRPQGPEKKEVFDRKGRADFEKIRVSDF